VSTSSTNTLGKYQIIREIARSNDIVYEAIDPSINRRVALKELSIPPNLDGAQRRERIERFWREGKAAGRLSHPNIVTVFEVGKDGDRHFIAMEFLEGQTLRDALQAGGPLPLPTVKNYMLQLCDALSYAHRNGVIHRDIKPENVQILPGGHIKLTDFGIARLIGEPNITQNGQVFGTPSYMSPEQVKGGEIDARSDIFSLGVLLYEMVSGKKPFTGDTIVTITYNITSVEPPPPPGVPPWLVGVIRKAMAKDPAMRYQSVDEMADDIREEKCSDPLLTTTNGTATYQSPFGVAQQQPTPATQYGTAMSPSGTTSSAPDPFAPITPAPPPTYAPPKPILSAETRNFLGVFFLVVGLAAMLVFAIWAVSLAYKSFVTAQTSGIAAAYYNKGVELYNKGALDAAERMFQNAIRVSPLSEQAEKARSAIYVIMISRAYELASARNAQALMDQAKRMVEFQPRAPEGHYYLGLAYEMQGNQQKAVEEYDTTSKLAGNDEQGYGKAARARRYAILGAKTQSQTNDDAIYKQPTSPQPQQNIPRNDSDIPYQPGNLGRE
jgi:serine/threonine-protein kinase